MLIQTHLFKKMQYRMTLLKTVLDHASRTYISTVDVQISISKLETVCPSCLDNDRRQRQLLL